MRVAFPTRERIDEFIRRKLVRASARSIQAYPDRAACPGALGDELAFKSTTQIQR
jgi:hypothetical protein